MPRGYRTRRGRVSHGHEACHLKPHPSRCLSGVRRQRRQVVNACRPSQSEWRRGLTDNHRAKPIGALSGAALVLFDQPANGRNQVDRDLHQSLCRRL
jgi:hypothetical protein